MNFGYAWHGTEVSIAPVDVMDVTANTKSIVIVVLMIRKIHSIGTMVVTIDLHNTFFPMIYGPFSNTLCPLNILPFWEKILLLKSIHRRKMLVFQWFIFQHVISNVLKKKKKKPLALLYHLNQGQFHVISTDGSYIYDEITIKLQTKGSFIFSCQIITLILNKWLRNSFHSAKIYLVSG